MGNNINLEDLFLGVYKDKRVLVLGHTGFKGSWLSLWLNMLGAKVIGFAKYIPTQPSHFEAIGLKSKLHDVQGDIRNYDELMSVFEECQPEIVFHLAAQPIVSDSYHDPKSTFDTNMGGTLNVLECIRNTSCVKAGVIITSDKCYENVGWAQGYKETDRLGGADPYSASKACAEIVFSSYFRSYFENNNKPKLASTRAGNVIGGGDWANDRIIPDCVRAFSQNETVKLRSPEATRPWQHVLEPLSGYLWLGALLYESDMNINGESYNFGPKPEVVQPVCDLVDRLSHHWGEANWEHIKPETEMKEATLLHLSCDKALEHLGWSAVLGFEDTIQFTAEWYRQFYTEGTDIESLSISQIRHYVYKACEQNMSWIGLSDCA